MKKLLVIIGVLALLLVACNSKEEVNNVNSSNEVTQETVKDIEDSIDENKGSEVENEIIEEKDIDDVMVFTAETLAEYNGENDMPAYVAVDGLVYDVSDVPAWQSPHAGSLKPGKDYSEEIKMSPHGKGKLEKLEIVGTYEE